MAASDNLRQAQFDLGGLEAPLPEHPGHLDRQEWATRQDVVHHGTYRKDWDQGSATHFAGNDDSPSTNAEGLPVTGGLSVPSGFLSKGTQSTRDWSEYGPHFNPHEDDIEEHTSQLGQGRIHSRRIEHEMPGQRNISSYSGPMLSVSDEEANLAHAAHGYLSEGEYPSSTVSESVPFRVGDDMKEDPYHVFNDDPVEESEHWTEQYPRAATGASELAQGNPIIYNNHIEGGVSAVVPRGAGRSYEQDFLDAPGRSPHAKALMEASQRQVGPLSTPVPQSPLFLGSQMKMADTNYMDEVDRGLPKAAPDIQPYDAIQQERGPVRAYPKPDLGGDPDANRIRPKSS